MNITARLTKDAVVRTTATGKQVVDFSVAVNDGYRTKDGEWINQTTYFDCAYWRSPKVATILTKASIVELSGRLSSRAWIGKDGLPKSALNFNVSTIKPHFSGKREATPTADAPVQGLNHVTAPVEDLPF